MRQHWHVIDRDGCHRIDVSETRWDFWSDFRPDDDPKARWPGFTQTVVCAAPADAVGALGRWAGNQDVGICDVTDRPGRWDDAICVASVDADSAAPVTAITEPTTDFDERWIRPALAEAIVGDMHVDGAFFGYDPAADTLMLMILSGGQPVFSWTDSTTAGPSHAVIFGADGRATHQDPRLFALDRLGQPASSPFLDRYSFVEAELAALGLTEIHPHLDTLPIAAAVELSRSGQTQLDLPAG